MWVAFEAHILFLWDSPAFDQITCYSIMTVNRTSQQVTAQGINFHVSLNQTPALVF